MKFSFYCTTCILHLDFRFRNCFRFKSPELILIALEKVKCFDQRIKALLPKPCSYVWNNLPSYVVSATYVKTLENRQNRKWNEHPMKYDYEKSDQTGSRVYKRVDNMDLNTDSDDFSCCRKYLKQAGGRGGRLKA